jgi:fumarate hydratase subunit beta
MKITTPFTDEAVRSLRAGDAVLITGSIYTARDAAHKRLVEMLSRGEPMPFDFAGQAVYYAGPSPTRPGAAVGSIGPTTSGRMDVYAPILMERGLKVMIGKGLRDDGVRDAIVKHRGLYLAAVGGAAALISRSVKKVEEVAFADLGPEAIRRLEVVDFPAVVAMDCEGNDVYKR